jgi:hypothetical protein
MIVDQDSDSHESIARFLAEGFLRITDVLPDEHFDDLRTRIDDGEAPAGAPLERILDSRKVATLLDSLLGPDRELVRVSSHTTLPGEGGQPLHVDGVRDLRGPRFDVQLLIFPQLTTQDMGGTRIVPRSHLRLVDNSCIGRYQHLTGELRAAGPTGTIYLVHSRLWHSGLRNDATTTRRMLRVRLRGRRQAACWNVSEETLGAVPLFTRGRWEDSTSSREADYELIKLIRFLTGHSEYDHQREYGLRYG